MLSILDNQSPSIILKILPIMLFEQCSHIMLNIIPKTTSIMPQFVYNLLVLIIRLA